MTEGVEDSSAGPIPSPGTVSPTGPPDAGLVPEEKAEEKPEEKAEEKPEETEAAGESEDEDVKGLPEEGGGDGDEEHEGDLENGALPATCCVCIEMGQINQCLRSEKICILPILACLLSLALCTAGLKWVFVDKIFEYEPPTHLDPKPIGQDQFVISINPTLGITVSIPHSPPSSVSLTTTIAITSGHPEGFVNEKSTTGKFVPQSPQVTYPSVTLKYNTERSTGPKQSPHPQTTQEINNIIQTLSTTSTSTTSRTSSHIMRCSDSQKNFCVNGGECFTLEITPGSTKFLCRCPNEFTGDRCQNYVMASFYKAEELYQKRILTISGICIALLVVGIMCVVAYCKTKKQRKKLHDRLRQSKKNKRKNNTSTGTCSNPKGSAVAHSTSNVPLQDLNIVSPSNGSATQQAAEETETTFPTSNYAAANQPTTLTNISSQRFTSAMRSPTQLSPDSKTVPTTPGSPLSETSAPLSSLAVSVPSVALSPSVEEERPLLLSKKKNQSHLSSRLDEQKRSFCHYNHVAHSLPPSPALTAKNVKYGVTGEHDTAAVSQSVSAIPERLNDQINNTSNSTTKVAACYVLHYKESSGDSMLFSETEDLQEGHSAFINAGSTTALWDMESSRTNPASSNSGLQVRYHNPVSV